MKEELNKIVESMTKRYTGLVRKTAGVISACAVLCAALGWWGVLYPQLTLTQDTYQMVSQSGEVQEQEPGREYDNDIYVEILNAGGSKVRFRSRLVKEISEWIDTIRQ